TRRSSDLVLRQSGDDGGNDEDDDQQVLKLLGKDLNGTLFLALRQLVGAVLLPPLGGLLIGQPPWSGLLGVQGLLGGFSVIRLCHMLSSLPIVFRRRAKEKRPFANRRAYLGSCRKVLLPIGCIPPGQFGRGVDGMALNYSLFNCGHHSIV